ncbi:MAG: Multidrug efflux pump subunit AcrA (membrane-fusion protein) [Verrucomicrobia bacterium]|nr:MAG: Multidrug efflux pump subunit AcrA (membrane-fusion protein) [Verrucomicrobiota bacterium]
MARPEQTLTEIEKLFAGLDPSAFDQAAVALTVSMTASRFGFLYEQSGPHLLAKVIVANDPQAAGFTAQQQVDLIATSAVAKGLSQRATISLATGKYALLCVPFTITGQPPAALALLLGPERAAHVESAFTVLHLVTQIFVRRAFGDHATRLQLGFDQATLLVDLFSRVAQAREFRAGMAMICDEMADLTGAARVAIGAGDQLQCKVHALSGAGHVETSSQATSQIAALMRESIGVDAPLAWPERNEWSGVLTAANHTPLLDTMSAAEALVVPLKTEPVGTKTAETVGAMVLLWSRERMGRRQEIDLVQAAAPHLAALVYLCGESLPRGVLGAWKRFWMTASRFRKTLTIAAPFLFLVAMLLPVPYRVSANCRLPPEVPRQVAAPFDGILERALVKPGQTVEAGQLLAVLDGKEIRWKLAEAIAKRESALKERDQAMAARDVAAKQLAQLQADGLGLQVDLLKYQRDHLEVRAPISGSLISGNLERSEGVPVTTGQKLFDIAPIDRLEVEIAVPDSEVAQVVSGQNVRFRLESQAQFRHGGVVSQVYPISEVRDGRNIFVCLSSIDNSRGELRPGMLGKARIEAGHRALGWTLFHRLWDWVRLNLW